MEVQDDWLAIENLGHGSFANVFRMRKRDDSGLEVMMQEAGRKRNDLFDSLPSSSSGRRTIQAHQNVEV